MISMEDEEKALTEWALAELKEVGQRSFEFSKYFFGISAGSFAIFSFFEAEVSLLNIAQLAGFCVLGLSALIAIKMADPADFTIGDDLELSIAHEKHANRTKSLRGWWLGVWILGVFLVFSGMTIDFSFADLLACLNG